MGLFERLERGLERAVNGVFAKAFKSSVQPVEIASAMRRAMDDRAAATSRISGRAGSTATVPNMFTVELSPSDYDDLAPQADDLTDELLAACEALRAAEPAPEQMRLLAEVRRETVPGLDSADTTAARLLLGDQGMQPWRRLGLVESATPGDVVRAATASLERWRTIAGDPLGREQTRRAARVLARSCEELLQEAWDVSAAGSPAAT